MERATRGDLSGRGYKAKALALVNALKPADGVAARVLAAEVSGKQLVEMDTRDLAPASIKKLVRLSTLLVTELPARMAPCLWGWRAHVRIALCACGCWL